MKHFQQQKEFIDYLRSLEPEGWDTQVTNTWTVKDVVAHMVGWEENDVNTIPLSWEKKEAPWYMNMDEYHEFNNEAVQRYRVFSPKDLVEKWEFFQEQVRFELEKIGEENIQSHPELFSAFLFDKDDERNHYQHHLKQIKDILEKQR